MFDSGITIGINHFYARRKPEILILNDTDDWYEDDPGLLLGIPKGLILFAGRPARNPDATKLLATWDRIVYWWDATSGYDPAPRTWDGRLSLSVTTATAACHLAALMGASEIILVGVDLLGSKRVWTPDGSPGSYHYATVDDNFFQRGWETVSNFLLELQTWGPPIYKTCKESPINVQFREFDEILCKSGPMLH